MPIAVYSGDGGGGGEAGRGRIERSGLRSCMPMYDRTEMFGEERRENGVVVESSSSSSSIGKNSDLEEKSGSNGGGGDGDGDEVESEFKGPLYTMDALEDVLPVKRGISKFYSGKSKSFTSLAEAESISSMKELIKPENLYSRKRKNMLLSSRSWDNRSLSSRVEGRGFPKRQAVSSRSTVSFAMTLSSTESSNSSESPNSASSSPSRSRPPLHPQMKSSLNGGGSVPSSPQRKFSPWRSFSLSDLQCVAASQHTVADPESCNVEEGNRQH